MTILLSTLNARYTHASLGLRYLLANMGPLQAQTRLQEFVIGTKTTELVERILVNKPRIIGFWRVYMERRGNNEAGGHAQARGARGHHRAGRAGSVA